MACFACDKLRVRLRHLEVQDLDMDAVCLPPFDVSRLLNDTAPTSRIVPHHAPTTSEYPAAKPSGEGIERPESAKSTPKTTGSAEYSDSRTLTIQVSGDDDQLSSVYFDVDDWRTRGMEVLIND